MGRFPSRQEVTPMVVRDLASRRETGIREYGGPLRVDTLGLLRSLEAAYEESLDQAVYLRAAIELLRGMAL